MRRRRTGRATQGLTLVPLADMLTNTVGIMLFILIFTVLVFDVQRVFPFERKTELTPTFFICANNRLMTTDIAESNRRYFTKVRESLNAAQGILDLIVRTRQVNEVGAQVEGDVEFTRQVVGFAPADGGLKILTQTVVKPLPGAGETVDRLLRSESRYAATLRRLDPAKTFAYFLVRPDCIDAFNAARDAAMENHFRYGWTPLGAGMPAVFGNSGDGTDATTVGGN
jgi:hypothetical protein